MGPEISRGEMSIEGHNQPVLVRTFDRLPSAELQRHAEMARVLAEHGVGPELVGIVENPDGTSALITRDVRGEPPSGVASEASAAHLREALTALRQAGYALTDPSYAVSPEGRVSILDPGSLRRVQGTEQPPLDVGAEVHRFREQALGEPVAQQSTAAMAQALEQGTGWARRVSAEQREALRVLLAGADPNAHIVLRRSPEGPLRLAELTVRPDGSRRWQLREVSADGSVRHLESRSFDAEGRVVLRATHPEEVQSAARTREAGDGRLVEHLLERIRPEANTGPEGERLRQFLHTQIRDRLLHEGLTPHERMLFDALTRPPADQLPITLYASRGGNAGNSGVPHNPHVWFQLGETPNRVNLGQGYELPNNQTPYEVFIHELSHAIDHYNQVPGYLDGQTEHRRIYSELRANLWATNFDYQRAFDVTAANYRGGLGNVMNELGLNGLPPRTAYEAIRRVSERMPETPRSPEERAQARRIAQSAVLEFGGERLPPTDPAYAFPQLPIDGPPRAVELRGPQGEEAVMYRAEGSIGEHRGTFEWAVARDGTVLGRSFQPEGTFDPSVAYVLEPGLQGFREVPSARDSGTRARAELQERAHTLVRQINPGGAVLEHQGAPLAPQAQADHLTRLVADYLEAGGARTAINSMVGQAVQAAERLPEAERPAAIFQDLSRLLERATERQRRS